MPLSWRNGQPIYWSRKVNTFSMTLASPKFYSVTITFALALAIVPWWWLLPCALGKELQKMKFLNVLGKLVPPSLPNQPPSVMHQPSFTAHRWEEFKTWLRCSHDRRWVRFVVNRCCLVDQNAVAWSSVLRYMWEENWEHACMPTRMSESRVGWLDIML
jgi:hypothetical protein